MLKNLLQRKKPTTQNNYTLQSPEQTIKENFNQQDKVLQMPLKNSIPKIKSTKKQQKTPLSVQQTIKYKRMFEDGICEIKEGLYSKTIKFSDMNYQIARREDQVEIFSKYCEFLNYFDSSIPFQITMVNKTIDKMEFQKQMFFAK